VVSTILNDLADTSLIKNLILNGDRTAQKSIESLQRKNAQLQELVDIHKGNPESQGGPGTPYGSVLMQNSSQIRTATELGLSRMNDQLRSELDQRSKIVEKEREKSRSTLRELNTANEQCYQLQQQLGQRENQIKGTLNRIEVIWLFCCTIFFCFDLCENHVLIRVLSALKLTPLKDAESTKGGDREYGPSPSNRRPLPLLGT
jgi:hypothetical protein